MWVLIANVVRDRLRTVKPLFATNWLYESRHTSV
jgi:hypothetical protein